MASCLFLYLSLYQHVRATVDEEEEEKEEEEEEETRSIIISRRRWRPRLAATSSLK
jgi:hypothetical protein